MVSPTLMVNQKLLYYYSLTILHFSRLGTDANQIFNQIISIHEITSHRQFLYAYCKKSTLARLYAFDTLPLILHIT